MALIKILEMQPASQLYQNLIIQVKSTQWFHILWSIFKCSCIFVNVNVLVVILKHLKCLAGYVKPWYAWWFMLLFLAAESVCYGCFSISLLYVLHWFCKRGLYFSSGFSFESYCYFTLWAIIFFLLFQSKEIIILLQVIQI